MHIIPAIDIIDGKCVRLEQGLYNRKKVYHEDPSQVAKMFEDHGISRLHLVDLDGAKANQVVNWKVLEKIVSETSLLVDWGGGIKSRKDLDLVFSNGANQVTIGSLAVENPVLFHTWLEDFGNGRLILGADLKNGKVATRGWQEVSDLPWQDFFKTHVTQGVKCIISTDISKDGMLAGPAVQLYSSMLKEYPEIHLIASGGISSVDDLEVLKDVGCFGAIIGKAIYERRITLSQLKPYI
ncbi:MAG: 1-(5-phosphoribosyl)-5-[(5-phosphoribosylamino)methylideneamino]imidazole-4-carboxamide isomerase [Saprospiraceae bacterium]|nr:1-(5-phosphoribosyl)-5-[(5-phosphoribosylamino)methylideneamino]imidazole-4-carboxamide isomerase [Saprospiraceae bacterium]